VRQAVRLPCAFPGSVSIQLVSFIGPGLLIFSSDSPCLAAVVADVGARRRDLDHVKLVKLPARGRDAAGPRVVVYHLPARTGAAVAWRAGILPQRSVIVQFVKIFLVVCGNLDGGRIVVHHLPAGAGRAGAYSAAKRPDHAGAVELVQIVAAGNHRDRIPVIGDHLPARA